MELRKDDFNENVDTIYFGGGTPSVLSVLDIEKLLNKIQSLCNILPNPEITLEANPDDLSSNYCHDLFSLGVNRLSIGIQSFFDEDLKAMNRAHTSYQAYAAVELSKAAHFKNLSIDLIYGLPNTDLNHWKKNLEIAYGMDLQHLSCYALTVEPKTALAHQVRHQKIFIPEDAEVIDQYDYLMNTCDVNGFTQYEISNFSKPGFRSRHNSNYWKGVTYLGIGPAAHSYNGVTRRWNVANNAQYMNALKENQSFFEEEFITAKIKYNEYIMIALRTMEGIDLNVIDEIYKDSFLQKAGSQLHKGFIYRHKNHYRLTRSGIHLADQVILDLFD